MSARNFIRLRGELADGRKVFAAADAMDCDRDKALGVLCRWLLWVDAHCESEVTGLDWHQVDELLGVDGAYRALSAIGWVEMYDGTVRVLEFDKYLSPTAKVRQATAARVAAFRTRRRAAEAGVVPAGMKALNKKATKKADKFRVVEDKSCVSVCYAKGNKRVDSFSKRTYGAKAARGIALNMCNALNAGATPDEYARLLEAYKKSCKKGDEA